MSDMNMEYISKLAQDCISKVPVIILGSGASIVHGIPGMPELREYLLRIDPQAISSNDVQAWTDFRHELENSDLETALNTVHLSESLTAQIVIKTWDYLAPFDSAAFQKTLVEHEPFPLTRLFRYMFGSTITEIHVITPNYDRIAEYAADVGQFAHYTGFNYGHLRTRNSTSRSRVFAGKQQARTVNIWKVHGSLDWFRDSSDVVVGLPLVEKRYPLMQPVIVTPGVEKYRLTHDEPFNSIKAAADNAMREAESYLCIGYGFNDRHLQTTLIERCRGQETSLVLLTKNITDKAKEFLNRVRCRRYLAIEESGAGSRIYSREYPNGVLLPTEQIWQLDSFLKMVIS